MGTVDVAAVRPPRMLDRRATWSLRQRITMIAVFVVVASIAFGGATMYWAASVENDEILDARLEQFGGTVLYFAERDLNMAAFNDPALLRPLKTRPSAALLYRYQIWSHEGVLLMHSHEASERTPLTALSQLGFSSVRIDGDEYRVFALPSSDRKLIIQVAENISERWLDIGSLTAYYMTYLLLPFGIVVVGAWVMLRRALHAVRSTAEQLDHRNPLDVTPLQIDNPPADLLPILRSIDTLFARVGRALSSERQFTSVAAHELRTPLAGLRAHAQLASTAHDEEELQFALQSIRAGVDRVTHLIQQLLDLARVDALPANDGEDIEAVNLQDVYRSVMLDLGARVAERQVRVAARFDAPAVRGHRVALSLLLRNLLDNAIRYSPPGSVVTVECALRGDHVALTVDDAGKGIPAPDRQSAFERFNRLGESRANGVGLGLSIVLSVVEMHGARIELLDSPSGGLRVLVSFPSTAAAAETAASTVQRAAL
jgi:signal transduction histidine kinase